MTDVPVCKTAAYTGEEFTIILFIVDHKEYNLGVYKRPHILYITTIPDIYPWFSPEVQLPLSYIPHVFYNLSHLQSFWISQPLTTSWNPFVLSVSTLSSPRPACIHRLKPTQHGYYLHTIRNTSFLLKLPTLKYLLQTSTPLRLFWRRFHNVEDMHQSLHHIHS